MMTTNDKQPHECTSDFISSKFDLYQTSAIWGSTQPDTLTSEIYLLQACGRAIGGSIWKVWLSLSLVSSTCWTLWSHELWASCNQSFRCRVSRPREVHSLSAIIKLIIIIIITSSSVSQGWVGIPVPVQSQEWKPLSRSLIMGMDFFIPFPFPNFRNAFFHSLPVPELWEWVFSFPFRSWIVGMDFFCSLSIPKFWE